METHHVIGGSLLAAAAMDAVAIMVVRGRIADEGQRRIVSLALASGAVLMAALGALILTGVIRLT
jgi:hypothetical protein